VRILDEAARNVSAALGVLRYDRAAPYMIDADRAAVIRSFAVALLIAPLFALHRLLAYDGLEIAASGEKAVLVETLRYAVAWLAWPVVTFEIARGLGATARWPRYIALMNWIQLPAMILVLMAAAVAAVAPDAIRGGVLLVADLLLAAWSMFAARLALEVSWLTALWLCALEFTIAVALSYFVDIALGTTRIAAGA
jgi:hypothetical protein